MMRIGETLSAGIGRDQLPELGGVNCAAGLRQVAGLVMSPQLAGGQLRDLAGERRPVRAARAGADGAPMQRERSTGRVTFAAHAAIIRAAIRLRGGYRYRAGFYIR